MLEELHPRRPVHSFINGDFISNRKYDYDPNRPNEFRECWDFLGKNHAFFEWLPFYKQYYFNTDIKRFFSIILRSRINLGLATTYFGHPIFTAADGSREAILLMRELRQLYIGPAIDKLDETLLRFFQNESVRHYKIGELIDHYGYPPITDEEVSYMKIGLV